MAKESYHHGDLRRALLTAAAAAIEEAGPAALSLRDLARRAGVSHAAPSHHFGDKKGLLTALATEGFDRLAADLEVSRERDGSFLELGVTYVRFARTHRAHFEVMFRPDLFHADDPAAREAGKRASDALYAGVADLPDSQALSESDGSGGLAGWSIAHGFATLANGGTLGPPGDDPDEAARRVLRHLLRR